MESYVVIFFVGLAWIIFATIQDIKTREVANWLTFSLIAVGLAFSVFYSLNMKSFFPLLYSLMGGLFYVALSFALYYGRVFAGGDAKLLIGVGFILPYSSWGGLFFLSLGFLFLLFFIGAIYSLVYSIFIVLKEKEKFKEGFLKEFKQAKGLFLFSFVLVVFLLIYSGAGKEAVFGGGIIFLLPLFYVYLMALDKSCMTKLVDAKDLQEGDWLEKDVVIGKKVIKASVHGLSKEEVKALQKVHKKVFVKEGIPFVPAFLISYLIMGLFLIVLKFDWQVLISRIF